jgi:hypothetical protein
MARLSRGAAIGGSFVCGLVFIESSVSTAGDGLVKE